MAKTALIVGGAGATGKHLINGLVQRGFEVTVLHRGVHEPEYLEPYRHLHADPHFAEPVIEAIGKETFDVVMVTYGRIEQLAHVFANRCERLLSIGGIPVYRGFVEAEASWPHGVPLLAREDHDTADPANIRSPKPRAFVQKMLAAERAVLDEHARGSYRASVFRYPRIYGAHAIVSQEWSLVKRVLDKRPFVLLPNAGFTLSTRCAAANAAHCVMLALDKPAASGQVFNCGDDQQYSLIQWTQIMLKALGADLEVMGLPPSLNHVAPQFALYGGTMFGHTLVSTDKARALLGYQDIVKAPEAIAESARWWFEHGKEHASTIIARDAFDYAHEDDVYQKLQAMTASVAVLDRSGLPFHSYPHPKQAMQSKDHLGR